MFEPPPDDTLYQTITRSIAIAPLVLLLIALIWLFWPVFDNHPPREHPSLRSVAILVLGDIGRSPRMMYHAESFSKIQFRTWLVGYGGEFHWFSVTRVCC